MNDPRQHTRNLGLALGIVEDAWQELQNGPWVQQQLGRPPARLPVLSPEEAARRAMLGSELLRRLAEVDEPSLPHAVALALRRVRFRAQSWAREADWYWLVADPLGVGFYGMFAPTAYCGGFALNSIHALLASFQFTESGDLDRYLGLVADYARLVDQFTARTAGQALRGVRMPREQVLQARALLGACRGSAATMLDVAALRLGSLPGDAFRRELVARIGGQVEPAFERALAGLSDDYLARAPEQVGLGQYPGGGEVYAELVKFHTTLDLTAGQVHARGLDRIAAIEAQMARVRSEAGFDGDAAAFLRRLGADPRWRASSTAGVTALFQRYIDRMAACFDEYFETAPRATYGVAALPEALQGSMTFGYYDASRPDRPRGEYLFNAANLTRQPLFNVAALNYHELVPGHHLHLATQQESDSLHPFCKHSFINAYNEGWAEYAATLAGEIGLYTEPEERYGRLVMDAFLTCRLVVDTGMNVLGWSLEQARDYMRAHSGMAEAEILTETVRYSCDIPAQSLAYKLGDTEILRLRDHMRAALGARFDLRKFHTTILGAGAMPLPDLAWHVQQTIERRA